MQALSILSVLFACFVALMNYHNTVTVNLLSPKFASITGLQVNTISCDMAIFTIAVFAFGASFILFIFAPLYNSLKDKYVAYKKELERGSITNTSSEAKIQVLENKIAVLEKALNDALKKKN